MRIFLLAALVFAAALPSVARDLSHRRWSSVYIGFGVSYARISHTEDLRHPFYDNTAYNLSGGTAHPSFPRISANGKALMLNVEYFFDSFIPNSSVIASFGYLHYPGTETIIPSPDNYPTKIGDSFMVSKTQYRARTSHSSFNGELLLNSDPLGINAFLSAGLGIGIPLSTKLVKSYELLLPANAQFIRNDSLAQAGHIRYTNNNRTIEFPEKEIAPQIYAKFGLRYNIYIDDIQIAPNIYYSLGLNDLADGEPGWKTNTFTAGIDLRYGL